MSGFSADIDHIDPVDDGSIQHDEDVFRGGAGLVWHPAIRALGWIAAWIAWAILAGILWECLSSLTPTSLQGAFEKTGIVCSLVVAGIVPLEIHARTLRLLDQARRRGTSDGYPAARSVIVSTAIGALAVYSLVAWRLLVGVAKWWRLASAQLPLVEVPQIQLPSSIGLSLLAVAAGLTFVMLRPIPAKHWRIWRLLGARKTLRGHGMMAVLRLRQDRKSFFFQAPLVSNIYAFALAAVLYRVLKPSFVGAGAALFLVNLSLWRTLDHLLPPGYLFLGRSDEESFSTFDVLRGRWPVFGVTLLNRDSAEWSRYYFAAAGAASRAGAASARFMNRPLAPRIWNLRSRGAMWESSVATLMRFVAVIVIDGRAKSYWIFDEVLWLAELGYIEKCFIVGKPDGSCPALSGALRWAEQDNVRLPPRAGQRLAAHVVTPDQIHGSTWTDAGSVVMKGVHRSSAAADPIPAARSSGVAMTERTDRQ